MLIDQSGKGGGSPPFNNNNSKMTLNIIYTNKFLGFNSKTAISPEHIFLTDDFLLHGDYIRNKIYPTTSIPLSIQSVRIIKPTSRKTKTHKDLF